MAVDAYFPRAHLIGCLQTLQTEFPTAAINLRITTMQSGENLLLDRVCALAVTIEDVPEVSPDAIERHFRSLTFVISQRRGYDLSPCEARLVELLGRST